MGKPPTEYGSEPTVSSRLRQASLVWPMGVAFVTLIFIMGRMSMQQEVLLSDFRRLTTAITSHMDSDGHRVALIRTENLSAQLVTMQRQIDELIRAQNRVVKNP